MSESAVLSAEEFLELSGPRCAVLGSPIEHSLSPVIHEAGYQALGLDMKYYRVDASEARDIRTIVQANDSEIKGLSITMPGKGTALELAELATKRAGDIGTANTLVPQEGGQWLADNTDVDGLGACLRAVEVQGVNLDGSTAIIVGNGGTARPAVTALAEAGVEKINVVARSERALNLQALIEGLDVEFSWTRLDAPELGLECGQASTLISTVPEEVALEYAPEFVRANSVIDVIYDPYPTGLLSAARQKRLPHADGLRMLAGQAEEQFFLFTGQRAPEGLFLKTLLDVRAEQ